VFALIITPSSFQTSAVVGLVKKLCIFAWSCS